MDSCPVVSSDLKASVKAACPVLVLASQSPNRRHLLEDCGVRVLARPQDINEMCGLTEPAAVVKTLSRQKMDSYLKSVFFDPTLPAVAVDTLVCLDGKLLGKPSDDDDAAKMLKMLSGRTHEVLSGLCVYNPATESTTEVFDTSLVRFHELSEDEIAWYISTGDPAGAAGAYKIQISGYRLIESISGSFSNIIGLPLEKLVQLLS